jgi:hypothetical protein
MWRLLSEGLDLNPANFEDLLEISSPYCNLWLAEAHQTVQTMCLATANASRPGLWLGRESRNRVGHLTCLLDLNAKQISAF